MAWGSSSVGARGCVALGLRDGAVVGECVERHALLAQSRVLRASESRNHPTLVWIEKISIGRSNVDLRRSERSAAQHFLTDEPLVIVFIEVRFESRIRRVIRSRPLPNIANHLMTAKRSLSVGKRADRSY